MGQHRGQHLTNILKFLIYKGFLGFNLQKYGLKGARRAPQFSKR